jgi:Xaa-Pro aminopeptidase
MSNINRSPEQRQKELMTQMPPHCLVVLGTGCVLSTQGAQFAPFSPHSNAYYLTSLDEPDIVLFLYKTASGLLQRAVLFHNPSGREKLWSQTHTLTIESLSALGYDNIFEWSKLTSLQQWLASLPCDIELFGVDLDEKVQALFSKPLESLALLKALAHLRCRKEPQELALLSTAAHISAQGHAKLASFWGHNESDWERLWRDHCWAFGARQQAYLPIIAAGSHSCCLHYHRNNQSTQSADWILIDAGAQWQYYASDITRTFFKTGTGTMLQTIYCSVLQLQKDLCSKAVIGATMADLEAQARQEMARWLVDWGFIAADLQKAQAAVPQYFPHRLGHHIGLDVHDMSALIDAHTPFEEGMVITIEPGFYLSPLLLPQTHPFLGLGIRIEDDVAISAGGPIILSHEAPKEWEEICLER